MGLGENGGERLCVCVCVSVLAHTSYAVQYFVSWGLMNDPGVNSVDPACFPGVPSEVKQDLFWTVQYYSRGDQGPLWVHSLW